MMIDAAFFRKSRGVLVVGAGRSGMAALRLLVQYGCHLAISDGGPLDRLSGKDQEWLRQHDVFQEFGGHQIDTFLRAECIVVSPGVPLDQPALAAARDKGIPLMGELALGALFTDIEIVAVTGTNGKTTVTTMIGDLLKADGRQVFVGGNIGTPLCEFVAGDGKADNLVLEVSSFQLDTAVAFQPHVAVLLNISPDHLDRYPTYQAYIDSKLSIFSRQQQTDFAVVNGDDDEIAKGCQAIPSVLRSFGSAKSSHACLVGSRAMIRLNEGQGEEYELPAHLVSSPNSDNCLAALLAVRLLGCAPGAIDRGLAGFSCLAHRLTDVATVNGVRYVDDSKATNIGAVKSALAGMAQPVHLIAGGRDKGGDYRLLAEEVQSRVKTLILIGEAADKMAVALSGMVAIKRAATMEAAVALAAAQANSGEVVLLSPACASFDMFSGYAERGDVFQKAVHDLQVKAVAQGGGARCA